MSNRIRRLVGFAWAGLLLIGCVSVPDPSELAALDSAQNSGSSGWVDSSADGGATTDRSVPAGDSAATDATATVAGTSTSVAAADSSECVVPDEEQAWQNRILELVNQARADAGLSILAHNTTLEAMAGDYACDMITGQFFAHVNPRSGETLEGRVAASGYEYQVVGENLAAGQTTPEQAFDDWMNSPTHRANILDPRFSELGVGVREGGDHGIYWVQHFGEPANANP